MNNKLINIAPSTPPSKGRGAYTTPRIVCIPLDNEISLALESNPPFGPDEEFSCSENLNSNPFGPISV